MINKFLYPNGGSETYIFKVAEELQRQGHTVEFFGMADERNIAGNRVGAAVGNMDFRASGRRLEKLLYPFKILYSTEAQAKIRQVIEDFKPDIAHLNNINFQLTPSILYELNKHRIPMVWTAHDYQLICPNHMLYIPGRGEICERCLPGRFRPCVQNRCTHGSLAKSALSALEAFFYRRRHTYRMVDKVICPSAFLESKLAAHPDIGDKTVMLHNFIDPAPRQPAQEGDYLLYFGRYDREKGIETLMQAARELPDIRFVFAGKGELEALVDQAPNIENLGFLSGEALAQTIRQARFTVYPSEWYENCPFSVMESQMLGTPVLGARIGGIPELIEEGKTGLLFESGSLADLKEKIQTLYRDEPLRGTLRAGCSELRFDDVETYTKKLLTIYRGEELTWESEAYTEL